MSERYQRAQRASGGEQPNPLEWMRKAQMVVFSLLLPSPINISITCNTFIRYSSRQSNTIEVGLVTSISNQTSLVVTVRRFLTWMQVVSIAGDRMVPNISFWPLNSVTNPYYLCDSDLTVEISTSSIIGLAFVFYHDDRVVTQLEGMANTYIVSSFFQSATLTVIHACTFVSFPSAHVPNNLLSCMPSTIFYQLMGIKQKMLLLLNTRSMSDRCSSSVSMNSIDAHTWNYIVTNLPHAATHETIVYKKTYLYKDEFCVEKYRTTQFTINLSLPMHLSYAQNIFGSGVGIGTRRVLKCALKQRGASAKVITQYQITHSDMLNIIPFEYNAEEVVRRGLQLKYIPQEMELTVSVRFRVVTGRDKIQPELDARNLADRIRPHNPEFDDYYPLFTNTSVFDGNISRINLTRRSVFLSNNREIAITDVINEMDRLL